MKTPETRIELLRNRVAYSALIVLSSVFMTACEDGAKKTSYEQYADLACGQGQTVPKALQQKTRELALDGYGLVSREAIRTEDGQGCVVSIFQRPVASAPNSK